MSENDKELIKEMMKHPGWTLLEKTIKANTDFYNMQAVQPEVDEHYRLILFAKAQGINEMFSLIEQLIK